MKAAWDRRLDETLTEYQHFQRWLGQPEAVRETPSDMQLACSREWSQRALAYDQLMSVPQSPEDCLREAFELLAVSMVVESRKLLRLCTEASHPVLTPKQIMQIGDMFIRVREALGNRTAGGQLRPDTPPELLEAVATLERFVL